jgi:hypothetical protein
MTFLAVLSGKYLPTCSPFLFNPSGMAWNRCLALMVRFLHLVEDLDVIKVVFDLLPLNMVVH